MAGHILQRLDEAEARLALVDVDVQVAQAAAAIEEAQVEDQLLERRHRLGLAVEEVSPSLETEGGEAQALPEEGGEAEEIETPKDEAPEVVPVQAEPDRPEVTEEPPAPSEP